MGNHDSYSDTDRVRRAVKKISRARCVKNRSFGFRSRRAPHQVPKSNGGGVNASLHYSSLGYVEASRTSATKQMSFFHRPESNPR